MAGSSAEGTPFRNVQQNPLFHGRNASEVPEERDHSAVFDKSVANAPARLFIVQKVIAEFMGTFLLVFAGCGAIMADENQNGVIGHVGIAATFGFAIMIMIYAVGHVSGGHFNPAVSIAMATVGRLPLRELLAYILGQFLGSLGASLALHLIFLHEPRLISFTVNQPSDGPLQSFVVEVMITFILMFVIAGVATDSRASGMMAGLAIGSTITLNGIYAGPISGASMNPARSLGSAIIAQNYKSLYVYMGGPIFGAIVAVWCYHALRSIKIQHLNANEPSSKV